MSSRPWQVSTIVFLVLTLLYWSNLQVNVTLKGFPLQAYFPQTQAAAINSSSSGSISSPITPATITGPFPKVDTKNPPNTNLTKILLSSEAKDMQNKVIPKEGTKSPYGLTFSLSTFYQMQKWDKLSVDPSVKSRYDSIAKSTLHPCCDAPISDCECGHALALRGVLKKMLQDGKSDKEITDELMLWDKYFFPRHYVIIGLALQKMGKPLSGINLTADYSSISVETAAGNYLMYE